MATEITLAAHAKINLTLDVGARRPDGYHDIRSVMQTVALHDTLTVRRTPDRPGVHLEVAGPEATGVPADETNLVHRAAVRLQKIAAARQKVPGHRSGLSIQLEKRIPSQAGLGGGSSDAAAALRAVNALLALHLNLPGLEKIGSALGADVPFFLTGGTALVEGLGERVTPLPPIDPAWDLVIVKPPIGISTAWAYAALDALPNRTPGRATAAWLAGTRMPHNDFQEVALAVPEVSAVFQFLRRTPPLLCGSGSALFCRVRDQLGGHALAVEVRQQGLGKVWLTQTTAGESR